MPFDLSTAKPVSSAPSNGGFDLSSAKPVDEKPKADFYDQLGTSLRQGFVSSGNLVDRAVSGAAGALANAVSGPDEADKVFREMDERVRQRNQWANPDNIDVGPLAGVLGKIPNLPANLSTALLSPFETGQEMIRNGESLGTAQAGQAISGIGNAIGFGTPAAVGTNIATKLLTGGISNALQSAGQGKALEAISNTPESKKQFGPTWRSTAEAALLGFGMGAIAPNKPVKDLFRKPNTVLDNLNKQSGFDLLTAKPVDEAPQPSTAMTPSQLKEWADLQEKYAAYKRGELPEQKQAAAQAAIDARQAQLEQDVARQGNLDRNAAERARQEAAPTGYAEWLEAKRQGANQRLPGNNEPMDLGPNRLTRANQYPDINDFPGLLQDAPYQYEGGIDYTAPRDQAALPVEVADILRTGDKNPDPFGRVSYGQNANRMAAPLEEHIANLNRSEGQPNALSRFEGEGNVPRTPKASVTPPDATIGRWEGEGGRLNRQRGMVDPDIIKDGIERLFHGGRKFGTWDPRTVGSGEGMGVMGPGLYAGNKQELAHQYLKYGGTDARLSDMAVDTSRILETAKKFTPEQREAYARATQALDDLGLRASQRGVKSAMAQAPRHLHDAARKALINAGIDGFKENLGGWGYEYVIFNPDVIKQISDATGPVEKYTGKFGQRGAINMDIMDPAYEKIKELANGIRLVFKGGQEPTVYATKDGQVIGHAAFMRDKFYQDPKATDTLEARWVQTIPEYQKQHVAREMYKFTNELGNDIQSSSVQTPFGKKMWSSFERQGLTEDKTSPIGNKYQTFKNKQSGALNIGDISGAFENENVKRRIFKAYTNIFQTLKDDFPAFAKIFNRQDVRDITHEMIKAELSPDPIQYWMEQLAGTTAKEDPTLGGQMKRMGKNVMMGQVKGPRDLLKLSMEDKAIPEAQEFQKIMIYLLDEYRKDHPNKPLEPVHPDPDTFKWNNAKNSDPFYHEERMKNPEYAKAYNEFEGKVNKWNNWIDQTGKELSKDYGFNPSGFTKDSLEFGNVNDIPWDIIHGVARHVLDSIMDDQTSNVISNVKRKQSGKIDIQSIKEEAEKVGKWFSSVGAKAMDNLTPKERIAISAIGDDSYIPKGDAPEKIIAAAKAQPDGPALFTQMQSGLGGAALKTDSAMMFGVNRHLQWAHKVAAKSFRELVKPIEQKLSILSTDDAITANGILRKEMFDRRTFTDQQLRDAGASDKVIKAYKALRDSFNDVYTKTNEARAKLGLEPITQQSAYYSSQWMGNWHMPVHDKSGNLIGYVKTETRAEANKAMAWIKKNMPEADVSSLKIEYKPENIGKALPRDVTSTFEAMMKIFEDTPMAQQMKEMMDQYRTEQAFNERGFSKHFEEKANTRFFLGDRPWLSDKENAHAGLKSQVQYLKDAYRWIPMQEAMANIKEVLSDPDLVKNQPNNMAVTKAYVANALGVSQSIMRGLENDVAKWTGRSPSSFGGWVSGLKSLTYLQQLGMSAGYAIATPAQAFILGPSRHMLLSKEGFKYNPITTTVKALKDMAALMATHEAYNVTGKDFRGKLSPVGRAALRYMEDNGIINMNLFDEYANLGENRAMNLGKNTIGATISFPEKMARTMTFMSFVHHLKEGGMEIGNDMFRKAEELTNATLTEFHKNARPLIVDRIGMTGELLYTYKSPLFNFYNSLFEFGRKASETGDYKPLLAALFMTTALGGVMNFPLMQEMDGAWSLMKDFIAKHFPNFYDSIRDTGVKQFALKHLPDVLTYGAMSSVTGAQMESRFSNQIIDPENPLGNVAPVAQEIKEQAALGKFAMHPNWTTFHEGLYQNLPPAAKGFQETTADSFKAEKRPDGTTTYYNPNKLDERQAYVNRTKSDETYRKLGLTSLPEARQRDVRYASGQESMRLETARDSSMTKMFDAVIRKDQEGVQKYATAYFKNDGNEQEFQSQLANKIMASGLTPEERQAVYLKTISDAKNIVRRLQMEQKVK